MQESVQGAHEESHAAPSPGRRALGLLLVVLIVVAVLWPLLRGEFVYDDLWLVAQNPNLHGFAALWRSLGESYWDFLDERSSENVGYWRPLTTIALFTGRMLADGEPVGFHAVSLALHACAVVLAYLLAERLLRDRIAALFVALLFGLHPVQVEAVGWISSVNDPLAGVFTLAALLAFLAWRERGSKGVPLASAALCFCALLSKESAVAALPLVAAVDLGRGLGRGPGEGRPATRLRDAFRPFLRAYGALFAAVAVYYAARIAVFGDAWAGFDRSTGHLGLTGGRDVSLRVELLGSALKLLVWPRELNLFRDTRPEIPWSDAGLWTSVLAIVALAAALAWAWRRREHVLFAGLLIVPAALLPAVLRIEALGRFSVSERYLYVSVFGFAVFAVGLLRRLAERGGLRRVAWTALAVVAALYAWRARERTVAWSSERALFAQSYEDNPKSPYVAWGLGRVMIDDYRRSGELEYLLQAREAFEHSLELGLKREDGTRDPEVLVTAEDRLQANLGLGWYYFFAALRNYDETTLDEALGVFEKTRSYFPDSFEATTATGIVMLQQGRLEEARARFLIALEENPKHVEAWFNLGKVEVSRRDLPKAKEAFERALALKQDDVDTLPRYAGVLVELGDPAQAKAALERAFAIDPERPEVLMGLGNLAAQQRDGGAALAWFDRLLKLDPTFALAHLQKGKVLSKMGQTQRALAELQKACELAPRDFEAHHAFGAFLIEQGMGKDALPYLERALELDPGNALAEELRAQIELLRAE